MSCHQHYDKIFQELFDLLIAFGVEFNIMIGLWQHIDSFLMVVISYLITVLNDLKLVETRPKISQILNESVIFFFVLKLYDIIFKLPFVVLFLNS